MNLMKCEKNDKNNITNDIKKNETNIECDIIGKTRICPSCQKEIVHKTKQIRNRAIKNNRLCLSCSISLKNENRILSKKTKQKLKIICRKNALDNIGKNSHFRGKTHSNLSREKIRRGIFNHLKKYGITAPRYNPNACKYFDRLNKKRGWNIQHAKNGGEVEVCGYFVDGYDKKKNIVIEYDENKHYNINGELRKKDIDRMNEICNNLKCRFYRVDEKGKALKLYAGNKT